MKQFSIRHYVIWLTLIPALLIAVGLEMYFLHDRSSALDQDLMERGMLIARQLASSSEYGVFSNNQTFLQNVVKGVLQQPDVSGVIILDKVSEILVETGDFSDQPENAKTDVNPAVPKDLATAKANPVSKIKNLVNQKSPISNIGERLLIYQPIMPEQVALGEFGVKPVVEKIGGVILEMSWTRTEKIKSQMSLVIAVTTILFILLSIILRYLASHRISSPIIELSEAVKMIGNGHLETRVSVSTQVTELSNLARGINAMTARLQLENETLHQRVDEATRLAAICFESNEGMMVSDPNGVIVRVNKAFSKITGYTDVEAIGQTPSLLKSGLHNKDFHVAMWESITNKGSWHGVMWNRRRNGETYPAWVTITAVKRGDGKVDYYIATYSDISERHRLQTERATLLRRNQAFMKNAIDGIHILDSQGNIVEANDSFCRMLGYTQEEVLLLNVADWDRNWSAEELKERIKLQSQDGASSTFETRHCRKNGTLLDIEISCTGVEIEGQNYLFASSRDITSRKLAENMLRVAAVTFEMHEAIMITDAHANIIRVNQAFQDITGYSSEEVLGKNPSILKSDRQDKTFYEAMWKQLLDKGSWSGEIWDRRKNGQIYPKMLTITAIKNDRQGISQYVGIFRDITENKKAEEVLVQQLSYLLKISFNEIYIFDANSLYFILTSEGAENNLGYSTGELKHFTLLDLCPSITKESFNQMLGLLRSGKQQSLFFETVLHRKNGSTYPVEARLQFIDLDTPLFMIIIQDITKYKAAESQLRNLSVHLQAVREEEKANFARDIHDHLGGTLAALKMDINWLMDEMSLNKEPSAYLKHIETMSQLLDEATSVTRQVITDLRPTILDDLGLCAALEWQAEQFNNRTGIECLVTCSEDYKYELDKIKTINLFRIFQESLTNVVRHSGASKVEVELRYVDEEVILAIKDNGCGMPEGHIVSNTSFGILGMRERVEQLSGRIIFQSPPSGGFIVEVILPNSSDNQIEEKT